MRKGLSYCFQQGLASSQGMRILGGYLSQPCSILEGLPRLVITFPRLPGQTPHSWAPVHTRLYLLCMPSYLATGCPACPLEFPQTPLHTHAPSHWLWLTLWILRAPGCLLEPPAPLTLHAHSPDRQLQLTCAHLLLNPRNCFLLSQELWTSYGWQTSELLCHLVGCTVKKGKSRFTVVTMQNSIILIFLLRSHVIFHTNNCKPIFTPSCIFPMRSEPWPEEGPPPFLNVIP